MGPRVDAVMMDIGVNDAQMTDSSRGLNLRHPGPLDSRYCQKMTGLTLAQLLANANVDDLETILKSYAGVIKAKALASEILESRYLMQNLSTTEQLLELFQNAHERFSYVWTEKEEGASDKNI